MKEAKKDLRWVRSERNLFRAFGEALASKPVGKISVTALAREADMNKSTFYLHYQDIFDLARAFAEHVADDVVAELGDCTELLGKPNAFISRFISVVGKPGRRALAGRLASNQLVMPFIDRLVDRICNELAAGQPEALRLDTRIKVTFVLVGLMGTLQRHLGEDGEAVSLVLEDLVSELRF